MRQKRTRALEDLLDRLERRGLVDFSRTFERLAQIVESGAPGDAIQAARLLLGYRYGGPRMTVSASVEVGPSPAAVLLEIARERRRRAIEANAEDVRVGDDSNPIPGMRE